MSATKDFPPCPLAGSGVHFWLLGAANHCRNRGVTTNDAERWIAERITRPPNPPNEIVSAIRKAYSEKFTGSGATYFKQEPKWPSVNLEQREAIIRDNGGLADLWELSPVRIEDNGRHAEEIIDRLFPGNPLLCCGQSNSSFDTKTREAWRGQLHNLQLIVPSPMSALTGLTKEGKESKHSLNNTGDRRFLICEFDSGTSDEHAALLIHLGGFAPLVCAVHSGGKSLHGWFFVEGQPDDKLTKFFHYAVSLGACHAPNSKCQFVRMPDGTRDNGKRQTVYFLNYLKGVL